MAYIGTQPIPRASLILTQGTFSSEAQQFNIPGGYQPGNIFVYINGYRLQTNEYTASDGISVDLGEPFPAGTDYIVEEIRSFTIPNHYTKTEVDALIQDLQDQINALS